MDIKLDGGHTDHNGPDVDEYEKRDVGKLLEREDKGEHMIGKALRKPVYGMKSVAGERCGHDPLVVRFM